jgi:hypothetical protein
MPRPHQRVDQRFVFAGDGVIQRRNVILPLPQRARPGDHRTDGAVREHPGRRELRQRDALAFSVSLQLLGDARG